MMKVFAAAMVAKGCPLPNVFGFLDGTFREFCRPGLDGYRGPAQQAQYLPQTKAKVPHIHTQAHAHVDRAPPHAPPTHAHGKM